jgi:hypothetical protein
VTVQSLFDESSLELELPPQLLLSPEVLSSVVEVPSVDDDDPDDDVDDDPQQLSLLSSSDDDDEEESHMSPIDPPRYAHPSAAPAVRPHPSLGGGT